MGLMLAGGVEEAICELLSSTGIFRVPSLQLFLSVLYIFRVTVSYRNGPFGENGADGLTLGLLRHRSSGKTRQVPINSRVNANSQTAPPELGKSRPTGARV